MRRAFTLLEMMAAVLLGSIVLLIIAGTLRGAMMSWEAVQKRVAENYHRRSVLDLVKRQSSSLFLRSEASQLGRGSNPGAFNANNSAAARNRNRGANANQSRGRQSRGFSMPEGAYFFRGTPQEVGFLSTVSFLSDFPGQVAVRYFVVQGEPGAEGDDFEDAGMGIGGDSVLMEEPFDPTVPFDTIDGNLYLCVEEKNLFLSMMNENMDDMVFDENDEELNGNPAPQFSGEVVDTRSMKLIGPLRSFSMRYRIPAQRRADEADSEEDWAPAWDLDSDGMYPSAIEFTLVYERPGSEDIATEDLPGIRMVIPIYDSNNLTRGRNRENF